MPGATLLQTTTALFADEGIDLAALGLGWARALPTVLFVPAFGLTALPIAARAALGFVLAVTIFPAISIEAAANVPWYIALGVEFVRGLPVAVAASVALWAAAMAGGLADNLRGAGDSLDGPGAHSCAALNCVIGRASPFGVLFSLVAAFIFFRAGGPTHVLQALIAPRPEGHIALAVARDVASGITVAISIAAPLVAASIVFEVAAALMARSATIAMSNGLITLARPIAILFAVGIFFEQIANIIARAMAR